MQVRSVALALQVRVLRSVYPLAIGSRPFGGLNRFAYGYMHASVGMRACETRQSSDTQKGAQLTLYSMSWSFRQAS